MGSIFVRHGLSVPDAGVAPEDWPLDPAGRAAIAALAERLPPLRVVCSGMRRAIETADFFGAPTVDTRLGEVVRPFVPELRAAVGEYFAGRALAGWEPQSEAVDRFTASVAAHGEAI